MNDMAPGKWYLISITQDDDGEYPVASVPVAWADVVAENERQRHTIERLRNVAKCARHSSKIITGKNAEINRQRHTIGRLVDMLALANDNIERYAADRTEIIKHIDRKLTDLGLNWDDAIPDDETLELEAWWELEQSQRLSDMELEIEEASDGTQ